VNPILFEPMPYPDADRVTMIWDYGNDGSRVFVTLCTLWNWGARRSFDAMAAMKHGSRP